ncbi:hypothetical protein L2E82_47322 [Cichorium intybus]|uniref:Uncharacterized protein n=1 Tax=Cichorium intybus TaxID=13427 RepID=A0ACB8YVR3_CICIN|nr:hypothetical protein L2E82_47322 [Cichorium intybus]
MLPLYNASSHFGNAYGMRRAFSDGDIKVVFDIKRRASSFSTRFHENDFTYRHGLPKKCFKCMQISFKRLDFWRTWEHEASWKGANIRVPSKLIIADEDIGFEVGQGNLQKEIICFSGIFYTVEILVNETVGSDDGSVEAGKKFPNVLSHIEIKTKIWPSKQEPKKLSSIGLIWLKSSGDMLY